MKGTPLAEQLGLGIVSPEVFSVGAPGEDRFWQKIKVDPLSGCWIWQNYLAKGYGRLMIDYKWVRAHRYAYALFLGPIDAGLEVHHGCLNRACVNPEHLKPLKKRKHTLLGSSPPARNARKKRCVHGHALKRREK
jgi:hypothetical protein